MQNVEYIIIIIRESAAVFLKQKSCTLDNSTLQKKNTAWHSDPILLKIKLTPA